MKTRFFLICCTVLILAGCATTEVIDTWKDDSQIQKFTKIYVLAVVKEPTYRRMVEYELVKILEEAGVDSQATFDLFPNVDQIDKTAASASIKENGVDGVMVVRLVDTKQETVYTPGETYVSGAYGGRYRGGWHGYYGGGYRVMSTPGYSTEYYISTVESTIYRTDENKRAWSTMTETSETSVPDAIDSYIKAMDKQLKSSGLF
jgi:hypothetical protein